MRARWRMAKIADSPEIERMNQEQEIATGLKTDAPCLFDKPVLLALVLDKGGEVPGGVYFEAEAEMCFLGIEPEVTARSKEIAPALKSFLKKRGIRWCRCHIPRAMKEVLGPALEEVGFVNQDEVLSHYSLDLRDGG